MEKKTGYKNVPRQDNEILLIPKTSLKTYLDCQLSVSKHLSPYPQFKSGIKRLKNIFFFSCVYVGEIIEECESITAVTERISGIISKSNPVSMNKILNK